MHSENNFIPISSFVRVGDVVGVVVGWPDGNQIVEEHYAIWYGQCSDLSIPQCRTVPIEHCELVTELSYYH